MIKNLVTSSPNNFVLRVLAKNNLATSSAAIKRAPKSLNDIPGPKCYPIIGSILSLKKFGKI